MPLSGSLNRTITAIRSIAGDAGRMTGAISRAIGLNRVYTGTAHIFAGISQGVKGAIYAASGSFRSSGAISRFASLLRTYTGSGQVFTGAVTRLINLLTRSTSGVAYIFVGAISRLISAFRTTTGIAQIFSGVATGLKGGITTYTATGIAHMLGAVTRLLGISRTYVASLHISASLSRLFSITKSTAGTISSWSGVVLTEYAEGGTLRKGYLYFVGTVSRMLNLYRMPTASFGMTGSVTRILMLQRTYSGNLRFSQGEFGIEGWKEEMYYGVRNP